jgi:hypothetical protein
MGTVKASPHIVNRARQAVTAPLAAAEQPALTETSHPPSQLASQLAARVGLQTTRALTPALTIRLSRQTTARLGPAVRPAIDLEVAVLFAAYFVSTTLRTAWA